MVDVTVLAPGRAVAGRHCASPTYRRRARPPITARHLLLAEPPRQTPRNNVQRFACSINLSRDFPQATLDRGDAFVPYIPTKPVDTGPDP